jgi:hypothetical protein
MEYYCAKESQEMCSQRTINLMNKKFTRLIFCDTHFIKDRLLASLERWQRRRLRLNMATPSTQRLGPATREL